MEATRKSVRVRSAPEVFAPPVEEARAPRLKKPPAPEDASDVNIGPDFQAALPLLRPRPAGPAPEEARFLEGLACRAGDAPAPPQHDPRQAAAMAAASVEER